MAGKINDVYTSQSSKNTTHIFPHPCYFFALPPCLFLSSSICRSLKHTQKHTKPCTMLIPVKLSLSFTAVTRFLILSVWSVIVQMMIIRGLYSHLISDILNWVSVHVCVHVSGLWSCLQSFMFRRPFRVNVDTLLSFTVKLIIFKWPVRAEVVVSGIYYWSAVNVM